MGVCIHVWKCSISIVCIYFIFPSNEKRKVLFFNILQDERNKFFYVKPLCYRTLHFCVFQFSTVYKPVLTGHKLFVRTYNFSSNLRTDYMSNIFEILRKTGKMRLFRQSVEYISAFLKKITSFIIVQKILEYRVFCAWNTIFLILLE